MKVPTTDAKLLRDLAGAEAPGRWADFVAAYRAPMLEFLRGAFPGADSDDLVQETLLALAAVLPRYRYDPAHKGRFRSYLFGILRNKAKAHLRARGRAAARDATVAAAQSDAAAAARNEAEEREWRHAVYEIALREVLDDPSLRERTKQIFLRTAIRGEAPESVAAAFGMKRNAVDQAKNRVLVRLKAKIAELEDV